MMMIIRSLHVYCAILASRTSCQTDMSGKLSIFYALACVTQPALVAGMTAAGRRPLFH